MNAAALLLAAASIITAPDTWRSETFDFPLRFAPGIPYEGQEHVRFNPKWDQFADDEGFSYIFVWDVKAVPVEPPDIEDHLETYFNGLMSNVSRGRKLDPPGKTVVAAHPMAQVRGWRQGFGADIRTFNSFSKNEPLLLRAEVLQRECGNGRMQIAYTVSKSPRDKPIWTTLRKVRDGITCGP